MATNTNSYHKLPRERVTRNADCGTPQSTDWMRSLSANEEKRPHYHAQDKRASYKLQLLLRVACIQETDQREPKSKVGLESKEH